MKKTQLFILTTVTALATLAGATAVKAADVPQTNHKSTNTILFEADDSATLPIDPTNPTQPVDPTQPIIDPDNPATGNKGPLSIDSVPNLVFGTEKIAGGAVDYNVDNANPFVQITDKRGTGAGWTLSATAGKFLATNTSSSNPELKGYTLSFVGGDVKASSLTPGVAPTITDFELSEGKLTPTLSAGTNAGRGTWIALYAGTADANEKIKLHLPQPADAESYEMTIDWTLSDIPVTPGVITTP